MGRRPPDVRKSGPRPDLIYSRYVEPRILGAFHPRCQGGEKPKSLEFESPSTKLSTPGDQCPDSRVAQE